MNNGLLNMHVYLWQMHLKHVKCKMYERICEKVFEEFHRKRGKRHFFFLHF